MITDFPVYDPNVSLPDEILQKYQRRITVIDFRSSLFNSNESNDTHQCNRICVPNEGATSSLNYMLGVQSTIDDITFAALNAYYVQSGETKTGAIVKSIKIAKSLMRSQLGGYVYEPSITVKNDNDVAKYFLLALEHEKSLRITVYIYRPWTLYGINLDFYIPYWAINDLNMYCSYKKYKHISKGDVIIYSNGSISLIKSIQSTKDGSIIIRDEAGNMSYGTEGVTIINSKLTKKII